MTDYLAIAVPPRFDWPSDCGVEYTRTRKPKTIKATPKSIIEKRIAECGICSMRFLDLAAELRLPVNALKSWIMRMADNGVFEGFSHNASVFRVQGLRS